MVFPFPSVKAKRTGISGHLVWNGKDYRYGELVGTDVIVSAKGVEKPEKLRYLHSSPWYGALYSEVNLPVGAFHIGE